MKINNIPKETITSFDKIKFGECFRAGNKERLYMKLSIPVWSATDREYNAIALDNGFPQTFALSDKVTKVNAKIHTAE